MKIKNSKGFIRYLILLIFFILVGGSTQVQAGDDESQIPLPFRNISTGATIPGDRVDGAWWESQVEYTAVINYLQEAELGFGTFVGYWQNVEQGHPQVDELYLIEVAVVGVGSPASGLQAAVLDFELPPSTSIDTSTYAIRCFGGPDMLEYTTGCPQSLPYDSMSGTYNIPSGQYDNTWPLAPGAGWQFWIPVKTSSTLSGEYLTGVIDNIEAMNTPDVLYPAVPIYVFSTAIDPPGPFYKTSPANGAVDVPIDTSLGSTDSANATSYEYCIDTSNDNDCSPWVDFGTPYDVLSPGTTYYWQFRALNSSGVTYADGASTAFWSFTTEEAATPPAAFGKTSPTNGATGLPLNPTLSWAVSNGANDYQFCYDTSNDNACSNWVSNGTSTSKSLSGLAADTVYYWQVRAVNDEGTTHANGSSTSFWSFRTEAPISPPGTFSKASPANGATNVQTSMTLNWGTSYGASSYEYCYDTTNDNACATWLNNGTSNSKSISGLDESTTYYWHVRARNDDGVTYANGSGTSFWSFRTADPISPPRAFRKARPWDNKIDLPTNPTLYWGASSGATSYEYCYDTSNNNACSSWVDNGTSRSVQLSGLASATTYYWQVRAKNSDGMTYANGSQAAYWSFKTAVPISANDGVLAISVQADGKILIGGYFTSINGVGRNHIARLNQDGSLDLGFDPNINGRVDAIALQPDGKILVGGNFSYVGTDPQNWVARLNPDGTLDTSFYSSPDNAVYSILVLPDGRILIGGAFTLIGSTPRTYLAMLNSSGSLNGSFPDVVLNHIVRTMALETDGSILIGGAFTLVNSVARTYMARLNEFGSLESSFHPIFNDLLMTIVVQPDGNILVGGQFDEVNEEKHGHIARLEPSGELEKYFSAQADDSITSIALQADGKMILGGYFSLINSEKYNHLVRLDWESNIDISFNYETNNLVTAVGLAYDGKVLVGGLFTQLNGETQNCIARLKNNSLSEQNLSIGENMFGDYIAWKLKYSSPQVYRVTFEKSTDGMTYTMLGNANYVGGEWVLNGLVLPDDQKMYLRARGYYSAGNFNGSGSVLETVVIFGNRIYLPLIMR